MTAASLLVLLMDFQSAKVWIATVRFFVFLVYCGWRLSGHRRKFENDGFGRNISFVNTLEVNIVKTNEPDKNEEIARLMIEDVDCKKEETERKRTKRDQKYSEN
jgi:hypothetical protein